VQAVVAGDDAGHLFQRSWAEDGMAGRPVPVLGRKVAEQGEQFPAGGDKSLERLDPVLAKILALLRPGSVSMPE
jgi:hypothetical protein